FDVRANDTEFDGQPLSVTHINGQAIAPGDSVAVGAGQLTLAPDGTLRFDPAGGYETLQAGQSVQETVSYTIADDQGATSTEDLTVTIHGVNGALVAADDEAATDESSAVGGNVLANDADVDGG